MRSVDPEIQLNVEDCSNGVHFAARIVLRIYQQRRRPGHIDLAQIVGDRTVGIQPVTAHINDVRVLGQFNFVDRYATDIALTGIGNAPLC